MNEDNRLTWRFLRWFCPASLLEEIEGDLQERYFADVKRLGPRKAGRRLTWNLVRYLRPGILLRHSVSIKQPHMLNHYFRFYFRSASRNRQAALTSLTGLVIGLSGAWLMGLFVEEELGYDSGPASANVYRIVFGETDDAGSAATPHILATELSNRYPGVTPIRFTNAGGARVNFFRGENRFMESAFYFTDPLAPAYFPFGLLKGYAVTCLADPFTIVITQRAARKFFGEEDPIGKTISMEWINEPYELTITGLIDERNNRSHITFDYLISMATAERLFRPQTYFTDWTANFSTDYVHVESPATAALINAQLTDLYREHMPQPVPAETNLRLQPVSRIHLYSHLSRELGRNADIKFVYLAACIGLLLLLVTLINYINVLSAVFVIRLKEVGIRKSLGAGGGNIFRQFLVESLMHVAIAAVIAMAVVFLVWPAFAQWGGLPAEYSIFFRPLSLWLIGAAIVAGLVAALYPSLLTARKPAGSILYGIASLKGSASWTRQLLVTFQVFIAMLILCGSLVVRNQMNYIREKDLGYQPESMITIPQGRSIRFRSEQIKNELLQTGKVAAATISSTIPSRSLNLKVAATVEGGNPDGTNTPWSVALVSVDYDFFESFGLRMVDGRNFSPQFPADSTSGLIINEAAVRALGWSSPLGKEITLTYNAGDGTVETRTGRVIGVVKDFNFESLHKTIEPIVFFCKPFWYYFLTLRLKAGDPEAVLAPIREKWSSQVSGVPFEYEFLTDRINNLYADESKWGAGINIFSAVAILVSSLGLFGLISFYLQTRMKELAVRKVLGAGIGSLAIRVYGQMFRLIALAALPALPLAWWLGNEWISGFAYRSPIGPGMFVTSLLILLVISTVSVAGRVLSAANVNPVVILKSS